MGDIFKKLDIFKNIWTAFLKKSEIAKKGCIYPRKIENNQSKLDVSKNVTYIQNRKINSRSIGYIQKM